MDPRNPQPFPTPCSGLLADLPSHLPSPICQPSTSYPYPGARREGQQGQPSSKARWARSRVGQPGCPTVPNQEQHWWWPQGQPTVPVSRQVHSDKAGPSWNQEVNQQVRVWIIPGIRHRHGSNISTAPEPRWEACLFLLPCAGASHCNPADGKVEGDYRPSKTLLSQTT